MKTIEERAREYAKPIDISDELLVRKEAVFLIEKRAFVAGAKSEHEELTRWHGPKEKPQEGAELLLKILMPVDEGDIKTYAVGDYIRNEFIMPNTYAGAKVLGWREIHE